MAFLLHTDLNPIDYEEHICALWNVSFDARFPMTPRLWRQNTAGDPDFRPSDVILALDDSGAVAGFALVKRVRHLSSSPSENLESYANVGFIAALAVGPESREHGLGKQLLAAGEAALWAEGASRIFVGGNMRVFFPGVPEDYAVAHRLFEAAGYSSAGFSLEYDLTGDLAPAVFEPALLRTEGVTYRQARQGEEAAVLAFLAQAFPGRWHYEVRLYLEQGGDVRDITLALDSDGAIAGFLMTYHPASAILGAPFMWVAQQEGWGGIGPLGVSQVVRGKGAGLGLVAAGMRHLYTLDVRHARIDWTTLTDFYGRLGFVPVETYRRYAKER